MICTSTQHNQRKTKVNKPQSDNTKCCNHNCEQGRNCPVRNATLEEVALEVNNFKAFEKDTMASFARYIRDLKK